MLDAAAALAAGAASCFDVDSASDTMSSSASAAPPATIAYRVIGLPLGTPAGASTLDGVPSGTRGAFGMWIAM